MACCGQRYTKCYSTFARLDQILSYQSRPELLWPQRRVLISPLYHYHRIVARLHTVHTRCTQIEPESGWKYTFSRYSDSRDMTRIVQKHAAIIRYALKSAIYSKRVAYRLRQIGPEMEENGRSTPLKSVISSMSRSIQIFPEPILTGSTY